MANYNNFIGFYNAISKADGDTVTQSNKRWTYNLSKNTFFEDNSYYIYGAAIGLSDTPSAQTIAGEKIFSGDVTVKNLTVSGTTTTINSSTLNIVDNNITLNDLVTPLTPSDTNANGGGLTILGSSDKLLIWRNLSPTVWYSNDNFAVENGKGFYTTNGSNTKKMMDYSLGSNILSLYTNGSASLVINDGSLSAGGTFSLTGRMLFGNGITFTGGLGDQFLAYSKNIPSYGIIDYTNGGLGVGISGFGGIGFFTGNIATERMRILSNGSVTVYSNSFTCGAISATTLGLSGGISMAGSITGATAIFGTSINVTDAFINSSGQMSGKGLTLRGGNPGIGGGILCNSIDANTGGITNSGAITTNNGNITMGTGTLSCSTITASSYGTISAGSITCTSLNTSNGNITMGTGTLSCSTITASSYGTISAGAITGTTLSLSGSISGATSISGTSLNVSTGAIVGGSLNVSSGSISGGYGTLSGLMVGTGSSGAALCINGAGSAHDHYYAGGEATGSTLYLLDSSNAADHGGSILFGGGTFGPFASIKGGLKNGTGPSGDLVFMTRSASASNIVERMRIFGDGTIELGRVNNVEVKIGNGDIGFAYNAGSSYIKLYGNIQLMDPFANTDGPLLYRGNNNRLTRGASSIRYKDNITSLEYTDIIQKLRSVSFNFKTSNTISYGFIAEEVELLNKTIVGYNEDNQPEYLKDIQFIPLLVLELQNQKKLIDVLEDKITTLLKI